jgi:hypothetical protein
VLKDERLKRAREAQAKAIYEDVGVLAGRWKVPPPLTAEDVKDQLMLQVQQVPVWYQTLGIRRY